MNQPEEDLKTSDYKFTFRQAGNALSSERHFSANNPTVAMQMFDLACKKDELSADEVDMAVWNRWTNRWDEVSEEDVPDSH